MLVSVGPGGAIVKLTALLVPPGVVTEMDCAPVCAPAAITRLAVMAVSGTPGAAAVDTPAGRIRGAPERPIPERVICSVVAAEPWAGLMLLSTGTGALMVNGNALLGPLGVVTI